MQTTENRLADVNGEQDTDPAEALKDAQAKIESHNRARVEGAKRDLEAICKRYNISLGTRQLIVNGQPSPTEVIINLL
jgi:hypothetical protein